MTRLYSYAEIEVIFYPPDEGGREKPPWLDDQKYRPHLRVPPNNNMLGVEFVDGPDGPAPFGKLICATVKFLYEPDVSYSELQEGVEIEVVEGAKVVGRGQVTRR